MLRQPGRTIVGQEAERKLGNDGMIGGFGDYDRWKLATPPEYEARETYLPGVGWVDEDSVCACGMVYEDECRCSEPHPDEVADFIDEAQAGRRRSASGGER